MLAINKITLWQWLFAWLILDSLILYLARPFFFFPINALLPGLVLMAYIFSRRSGKILTNGHLLSLVAVAIGLSLAVALGVEDAWESFKQILSAACALMIGYHSTRRDEDLRPLLLLLALVGFLYALVCVAALLGVSSTYLPVNYARGFNNGIPVARAELTTDQNYQIYYLFPVMLGLVLRQKIWKTLLLLSGVVASLYVIIMMETRSGLLLLMALLGIIVLLPVWYKQKNSINRVFVLGAMILLVGLIKLPEIIELSQGMIRRFTDSDLATFWGRIESITYLFKHIYNPFWWLPKGQGVFMDEYGSFPHSAPTSIFLRAGMLGLVGWVFLIIWPVIKGAGLVIKRKINIYQAAIVFGALISLVASFSLPAALFEQVWLWGGACWGVVEFSRTQRRRVNRNHV